MGGIKGKGQQIELKNIVPWIDDLRIENVFEVKNEKKGTGVIDLIKGLVEILRLETEELWDTAQQAFEPVEPWNKG